MKNVKFMFQYKINLITFKLRGLTCLLYTVVPTSIHVLNLLQCYIVLCHVCHIGFIEELGQMFVISLLEDFYMLIRTKSLHAEATGAPISNTLLYRVAFPIFLSKIPEHLSFPLCPPPHYLIKERKQSLLLLNHPRPTGERIQKQKEQTVGLWPHPLIPQLGEMREKSSHCQTVGFCRLPPLHLWLPRLPPPLQVYLESTM